MTQKRLNSASESAEQPPVSRPSNLISFEPQERSKVGRHDLAGQTANAPGHDVPAERDSYTATALEEVYNRSFHAAMSRVTQGLSPAALAQARQDWLLHLASAPGKQMALFEKAARKWMKLAKFTAQAGVERADDQQACIEPLPQDSRFSGEAWQQWPFNLYYQSFLLQQQWWHNVTTGVPGVTDQHERVLEFTARQMLDVFAPSNFLLTNPDVLARTQKEGGQNLLRGFQNLMEDIERNFAGKGPVGAENFVPGENVAVTPGKVVYRNRLIELIQYCPATDKVRPEPVLIVPAWINKYYILDLSPQNSMVKYLTEQGYTVFIVSWLNPGPEERDLGMDDYRELGVLASLDVIQSIVPDQKVHATGYCLGGTLLSITAAALARNHSPIASLSFLATQVDFSEPGELQLFINESQLNFLDDMMWEQGFLDAKQMSGAFQLLRSNDLIWSRNMREYLLGERSEMIDLMAWNADSTRMPYRMHSEYLRKLYLNNDFAEGRFKVDGRPVTIADIEAPIFSVGTVHDHVAPWHSVYKSHLLADTEITFVLTSGGHNAGIVSEPGHKRRRYQVAVTSEHDRYIDPETWAAETPVKDGSWWPEWVAWLDKRSGEPTAPPTIGAPANGFPPLCDAPGTYVLRK